MSNKSDILGDLFIRTYVAEGVDYIRLARSRAGYLRMILGKRRKALKAKRKAERQNRKKGRK